MRTWRFISCRRIRYRNYRIHGGWPAPAFFGRVGCDAADSLIVIRAIALFRVRTRPQDLTVPEFVVPTLRKKHAKSGPPVPGKSRPLSSEGGIIIPPSFLIPPCSTSERKRSPPFPARAHKSAGTRAQRSSGYPANP